MEKGLYLVKTIVGGCFLVVGFLIAGCNVDENVIVDEQPVNDQTIDSSPDTGEQSDSIVGENLLLNSSVEKWMTSPCEHPLDWCLPSGYCDKVKKNRDTVYIGQYSARMKALESGVTARIAQEVCISPGSKIRIQFKYYIAKWKTNGARTYCYFRTSSPGSKDISIAELRAFYTTDDYYIIRGGGKGLKYLPHDIGYWQTFDEVIDVPTNAYYFELGINSYFGTVLYVDDFYVVEINE